ncbi:hypothetical protein FCV62_20400 [Vibrio kanaloae]|nr:hypothetical protein FCV62_20400 [Vibrio kanaloae]
MYLIFVNRLFVTKEVIPITVSKCSEIAQEKGLRTRRNFLISSYSTIKNHNAVIEIFNKLR